jgi:hypothetical protein
LTHHQHTKKTSESLGTDTDVYRGSPYLIILNEYNSVGDVFFELMAAEIYDRDSVLAVNSDGRVFLIGIFLINVGFLLNDLVPNLGAHSVTETAISRSLSGFGLICWDKRLF